MTKTIIDAVNDTEGNIKAVRFEGNATFTDLKTAIRMAERGEIERVHVVRRMDANTHLRTNRDKSQANNLDELAARHSTKPKSARR